MEKDYDFPPTYDAINCHSPRSRRQRLRRRGFRLAVVLFIAYLLYCHFLLNYGTQSGPSITLSFERLQADYATCGKLRQTPQDPSGHRERSARYVEGQKPVLIHNVTVWTGEPSPDVTPEEAREGKGYSWIHADVLLEKGLISRVGHITDEELPADYELFNGHGRQLTAGIIDMHSHTGVDSLPELRGAEDTNELSNDITPFVRSLDGLNPLDPQIQVIKSGGVTTSLILPGSGNNIGGEAFVIKHSVGQKNGRPELSINDLLADPERNWRYMKMACGENAKRIYGRLGRDFGPFSRLGEAWYFRHAFEEATRFKNLQDDWCAQADRVGPENMLSYLPSDLKWESLSAVLRGQVMVNTHCYTVPDLESFIGYTNEFKFSIRAFHHAHSTYLIPEVLKRAYGGRPPAAALFADNMNYKAEAYVASEKAGKILYENGLTPVYVSDNPVLNAQHVVFEAAKAYKNGLKYHAALAGVTSASAELLGLGHRIGKVAPGFDADVVVWDSDPLAVGATPLQVFIDGTPQFPGATNLSKPLTPPLERFRGNYRDLRDDPTETKDVVFTGVVSAAKFPNLGGAFKNATGTNLVISNGQIVCYGECADAVAAASNIVRLEAGHVVPTLTAFGSFLGIEEIAGETNTQDGALDQSSFSRAVDGLSFEGKNLRAAWSHGVTRAITAPKFGSSHHKGVSAGFQIGAKHALETGAVFAEDAALHYTIGIAAKREKTPTISASVADLRSRLIDAIRSTTKPHDKTAEDQALDKVLAGNMTLVISVHSADVIASILRLKSDVEAIVAAAAAQHSTAAAANKLHFAILGGAESHLLASELAKADVGVILRPLFSYAVTWDQRRALTGAPLTNGTAVDVLHAAGVKVAIGVDEDWEARDLFLQAGTVHVNSRGRISETEALAMVTTNIYDIVHLSEEDDSMPAKFPEFVVCEGNPLMIDSQVRAIADGRGIVSVWGKD